MCHKVTLLQQYCNIGVIVLYYNLEVGRAAIYCAPAGIVLQQSYELVH